VEVPIAIAADRVVTLTSFGIVPLRAELRDDAGRVLERASGRTDDWNIACRVSCGPGTIGWHWLSCDRRLKGDLASTGKRDDHRVMTLGRATMKVWTVTPTARQPAKIPVRKKPTPTSRTRMSRRRLTGLRRARDHTLVAADGPNVPLAGAGSALVSGDGVQHVVLPPRQLAVCWWPPPRRRLN